MINNFGEIVSPMKRFSFTAEEDIPCGIMSLQSLHPSDLLIKTPAVVSAPDPGFGSTLIYGNLLVQN